MKYAQVTTGSSKDKGFTFLEIIFAIVAASILSVVFVQLIGGSFLRSVEPIQQLDDGYELKRIMENITAHYEKLVRNNPDPLGTLKSDIENGNTAASDPRFGTYTETTKYLSFDSDGNEEEIACSPSNQCPVLKVTIRHNEQTMTALFSR